MNALRHPSRILLALVCLSGSLRAGVVGPKPLTAAIGMMQSVPAFRASVLEQVGFLGSLSALPAPSLSPFVSAVPSASDPWRVPATQLVGALAAQPQAIAAHQDDLRAALGKQGAESLMKSSARLQARASKDSGLRAQLNDLRSELDLNDTEAIQELGTRLNALFENSKSHPEDALRSAVAGADSSQKKIPVSWKLKPAAAPTQLNRDYADRFSRIPGVDSVGLAPITRVATLVEVPTGRTDVTVDFHSAEALATARKSGSLPLFGDLRGWFTGYHIIARVSPEVVARERAALDEGYRERFSKIPGVDSVELSPITRVATIVEVPTGRTDVFVNFRSAEALATARKSGSLPLFGDLRGWFTGYHIVARVNSPAQEAK